MNARMAPDPGDTSLAYLNGQFIPASLAELPVWDRGIVQGATVTEMIRTFRRVPFRLAEHLARFRSSLDYIGITLTQSDHELAEIVQKLVQSRSSRMPPDGDLGIVMLATPGAIPMYAGDVAVSSSPTLCIHTFSLPFAQWAGKYQSGQALVVPSIRQIPTEILDPRFKYRSRLHWYLADREAHAADPSAVALLKNERECLTETNSGNFFIVRQGTVRTARETDVLPGISQQFVKELAEELEIPYEVGDITVESVLQAEEAFLTSTTYCVLPVTRLNRQVIGSGISGPVTRRLLQRWSERVGLDIVDQANQDQRLP